MIVQFASRSYRHPSLPISAQRAVNCYAEKEPPDAKTQVALLGSPGLPQFADVGNGGPIRGMITLGGTLYVVSGVGLYSVSSAGTPVLLGGAISGISPVSTDTNGTQIAIVNGQFGYIYSVAGGFALISDADFNAANTVRFIDQRFAFDEKDTNRWFISDSLDGISYDSPAFTSAESRPDNVKAIEVNSQVIYVFGDKTIELYQNVGAANFPFERVPGAVIERGLAAPLCIAKEDNGVFFLGEDRIFYRINGQTLLRVSDHAAEGAWRDYTTVSDAFSFAYSWGGHKFIAVTFPTANVTWHMDISTGLWHERESWNSNGESLGRWVGNCYCEAYGKQLIGDAFSGKIGYLDASTFTEFGNTMRAIATAPSIHSDRKRVFHSRFELDVESGVGVISGQGSDPQIMLDYSDDGGRTFSSRQMWRSMGRQGAYKSRLRWLRMGQSRDRIYRVQISDPVRRSIIAANVDAKAGL